MFASQGYDATSLQDIADELDILKGSIYYYIDSKEDLLFEVVREVLEGGRRRVEAAAQSDGSAVDRIEAVIRVHVEHLIERLTETTVYLHEARQLTSERRKQLPVPVFSSILEELIEEGRRDGSVRHDFDSHIVAMSLLGSANWVYRWYTPASSLDPARIVDQVALMCRAAVESSPSES